MSSATTAREMTSVTIAGICHVELSNSGFVVTILTTAPTEANTVSTRTSVETGRLQSILGGSRASNKKGHDTPGSKGGMATVAVLADPPVEGAVLSDIVAETPLTESDAANLYSAMLVDVCRAVEDSGADLLINYRPADQVAGDVDPEQELHDLLDGLLDAPGAARYEVQVGKTFSGRVGNTVTHMLESEDEATVAAVRPTAPFLNRQIVGSAAMKLRSSDIVLGPTSDGRVYYAGYGEPIDFDDAYQPPAVETLATRAEAADLEVDFLEMTPVVETGRDLITALAQIRARKRVGRIVPARTAAMIEELGLGLEDGPDGLRVTRGSDRS
jgi:hypothetical protein